MPLSNRRRKGKDVVVGVTQSLLDQLIAGMRGEKWSWVGLNHAPAETINNNLVFISVDGKVVGHFTITDANRGSKILTYVFNKDTWVELKKPIASNLSPSNHKYKWWK